MIERILARYGYHKIAPRHGWQMMAETPEANLTEYGLSRLPEWKHRRNLVIAMWAAIDALNEPYKCGDGK